MQILKFLFANLLLYLIADFKKEVK